MRVLSMFKGMQIKPFLSRLILTMDVGSDLMLINLAQKLSKQRAGQQKLPSKKLAFTRLPSNVDTGYGRAETREDGNHLDLLRIGTTGSYLMFECNCMKTQPAASFNG
jgi:hypothetical protein